MLTMQKTAWEILEEVIAAIRRDPASYDQRDWMRDTACGTTMCVAGHIAAQVNKHAVMSVNVCRIAEGALGCKPWDFATRLEGDVALLFGGGGFPLHDSLDLAGLKVGTPEYVEAGIDRITSFMLAHTEHLRNHLVECVVAGDDQ